MLGNQTFCQPPKTPTDKGPPEQTKIRKFKKHPKNNLFKRNFLLKDSLKLFLKEKNKQKFIVISNIAGRSGT